MTAAVRISRRAAEALASEFPHPYLDRALDELRRALAPRPKSSAKKKTAARNRAKAKETRSIYAEVEKRAGGKCEACGVGFCGMDPAELDHQAGRGKAPQTVENCWLLHRSCHRQKTNNSPSALVWLERYRAHCYRNDYHAEANRAEARIDSLTLSRGAR